MALEVIVQNLSFQYWKEMPNALADVSLTIRPGSVCAVLGPTNAGKTTLLQAVSGVLGSHHSHSVAGGTIRIGGDSYQPLPVRVLFPTVGLTTQEPYFQVSGLRESVREEVSLTLESLGTDRAEAEVRTEEILGQLGLSALADRKPFTLSGGELQRVALATILVAAPPVLLMDEPCNSLDTLARQRLASIIRSLKGSTTILVADHHIDFALGIADSFAVLEKGQIVFNGSKKEFVERLADFSSLLPVSHWIRAFEAIRESPVKQRILRTMGIQ